jgi:hypothetical protein
MVHEPYSTLMREFEFMMHSTKKETGQRKTKKKSRDVPISLEEEKSLVLRNQVN